MKKVFFMSLWGLSCTSTLAQGDCYEKLMNDFVTGDSAFHRIHMDEIPYNDEIRSLGPQNVYHLVNSLKTKVGCDAEDIASPIRTASCHQFSQTTVCEVTDQFGFYLISNDYVDSYNFTFNRWD